MSLLLALAGGGGGGLSLFLSCAAGSYAVTGKAATLSKGVKLSAVAGSYAVSGQSATLSKAIKIAANSGAYSATGQSASLSKGMRLSAASGAYTVTGKPATLNKGLRLAANNGAYTVNGQAATLTSSAATTYARLPRLPLDPLLPKILDMSLMVNRVSQVYRVISAFHNTVTHSISGTHEQMPLLMPTASTLQGLKVAWNTQLALIARRHNEIAASVGGQPMPSLHLLSVDSPASFRVQFYDQYREITRRYNALAKIIDTANGY